MAILLKNFFKGAKPSAKPKSRSPLKEGDKYSPIPYNSYTDPSSLRNSGDTQTVIKNLQNYDPDFGNAIWAILRFSDTPLKIIFRKDKGEFDAKKTLEFINLITNTWVSSTNAPSPRELGTNIIQQLFMFGGVGAEVILDEFKLPTRTVLVAAKELEWKKSNGSFIPIQMNQGKEIKLDIPTFFYTATDLHPDQAAADSPLLSAVQAAVFKQQVITDIQRVIRRAGYPRHKVTILEEILRSNAPANIRTDPDELEKWLIKQKESISEGLAKLKPEDAIVIFDSIEIDYLSTGSNTTVDFKPIVEILDGQLTSSLRVLPSILGKSGMGGSSQNIASVESMLFINTVTYLQNRAAKLLSQIYTIMARLQGMKGLIEVTYEPVNLRPDLELEPQRLAKQNRILQLQSFGHITDSEAALELGILHEPTEELSGTRFLDSKPGTDTENISANTDPLGRSITGGDGSGDTRGNESSS